MVALQRRCNRCRSRHDVNHILTLTSEKYRELLENGSWNNANESNINVFFRCNKYGYTGKDFTVLRMDTNPSNIVPTLFHIKKNGLSLRIPVIS